MLLFSAAYLLLAAHIRSEGFGNIDAAFGIEVVFEERYEHSRRGNNGVVERMGKVLANQYINKRYMGWQHEDRKKKKYCR